MTRSRSKHRSMRRVIAGCIGTTLLVALILGPNLPWSARCHRVLRRLLIRAEIQFAVWHGQQPRVVSITGKLSGYGAQVEALKGARVVALESSSGYCALTDSEGKFNLPHLMWYPGASYNLIVAADTFHLRRLKVRAPSSCPDNVLDVGELQFDEGNEVRREDEPVRYMEYDRDNRDYYRNLCARLTENCETDGEKIDAINKYVASKLNYGERTASFKSPREVLERGSCYCSNLALAMAAITEAAGYPTRTIHLCDSPEYQNTHVVVEAYYGDEWHAYDPTYGVFFLNQAGAVASYKELRLAPSLVTAQAFQGFRPETTESILAWMPKTYGAGFHQIYQVNKSEICYDR